MTEVKLDNPQRFNRYSYALSNPYRYHDASGRDTVIIITRDYTFGSHAALRIDNNGHPVLYDPGGSYAAKDAEGQLVESSGRDAFYDEAADLDAFIKYHESTGSEVETCRFKTTAEQEKQIAERIDEYGGGYRAGQCSVGVCDMLRGIGPFKDLSVSPFPGSLADELNRLKRDPYRFLKKFLFFGNLP
jgi:hypothetical protein